MCKKQKPSQMNVPWVIPSIPIRREQYCARISPVRSFQTSSIAKRKIRSSCRADTGCSPPSRIMTGIRNLALFTSFYLRDLCSQVNVQCPTQSGPVVADGRSHLLSFRLSLFFLPVSSPFPLSPSPSPFVGGRGSSEPYLHFRHWLPLSLVFLALCLRCRISQSAHPANLFLTIILNVT